MEDEKFQIGSGNWSQLNKSSRCSTSPQPPSSSTTYAWPIQVVDVTKQRLHQDHFNLQYMTGLGLSSQPAEWNQPSLFDESCGFRLMLEEENEHSSSSTTNFQQAKQQWPPRSQKRMMYSSSSSATADSEGVVFSALNPSQFSTAGGFHMHSSSSIQYQINPSTTSMLTGLLGYETNDQPPQQHSTPSVNNFSNYYTTSNGMNLLSQHLTLQPNSWHASPAAPIINHDVRSNLFPSLHMTFDENPKKSSSSSETSNKRPWNETASPLPGKPKKKEKMGDRITALQQLVLPFGKTDTASVLSEAIEYIMFLHEQVSVLSKAYMKTGAPIQQQKCEKLNDEEGKQQDLRSRGLCLVPVSSTFPVTHETTVDFWNPTFGGSFR